MKAILVLLSITCSAASLLSPSSLSFVSPSSRQRSSWTTLSRASRRYASSRAPPPRMVLGLKNIVTAVGSAAKGVVGGSVAKVVNKDAIPSLSRFIEPVALWEPLPAESALPTKLSDKEEPLAFKVVQRSSTMAVSLRHRTALEAHWTVQALVGAAPDGGSSYVAYVDILPDDLMVSRGCCFKARVEVPSAASAASFSIAPPCAPGEREPPPLRMGVIINLHWQYRVRDECRKGTFSYLVLGDGGICELAGLPAGSKGSGCGEEGKCTITMSTESGDTTVRIG